MKKILHEKTCRKVVFLEKDKGKQRKQLSEIFDLDDPSQLESTYGGANHFKFEVDSWIQDEIAFFAQLEAPPVAESTAAAAAGAMDAAGAAAAPGASVLSPASVAATPVASAAVSVGLTPGMSQAAAGAYSLPAHWTGVTPVTTVAPSTVTPGSVNSAPGPASVPAASPPLPRGVTATQPLPDLSHSTHSR